MKPWTKGLNMRDWKEGGGVWKITGVSKVESVPVTASTTDSWVSLGFRSRDETVELICIYW